MQTRCASFILQKKDEGKSLPVSPTRIKPASHSYQYGVVGETSTRAQSLPISSDALLSKHGEMEDNLDVGTCTVKAMANKYQHKQNQHSLRQAILKGSMAPRGSCQQFWTSSESIKTESFDSVDGLEPVLSSHSRQTGTLGSLNSTPNLKSSSTPKVILTNNSKRTLTCDPQPAPNNNPKPAAKPADCQYVVDSLTLNESQPLLNSAKPDREAEVMKEEEGPADSKKPAIQKRRAFIEDIKQKYLLLEGKSLSEDASPDLRYRSPLLKFRSPDQGRLRENSTIAPETEEEEPGGKPSSEVKTCTDTTLNLFAGHCSPVLNTSQPKTMLVGGKVSPKCTSFEDDSFWAITSLGLKEDKNIMTRSDNLKTENDVFNVLHADYPRQGCRVVVKAEGLDVHTSYYQGREQQPGNAQLWSQPISFKDDIQHKKAKPKPSELIEKRTLLSSELLAGAQLETLEEKMKTDLDNAQTLLFGENTGQDKNSFIEDHTVTLINKIEEDYSFTFKDKHNETFTLDSGKHTIFLLCPCRRRA
ncbi:hypothetical protein ElyMa_005246000 [Elysia marginata]|uniref:Uncharacterized protein n=1 Tax=Elysia marginata TaxID=1093978 RepID=A0AAV4JY41_9GAST|nr:hypothetical protein ElyMa_005246000 [Elysia marginata]